MVGIPNVNSLIRIIGSAGPGEIEGGRVGDEWTFDRSPLNELALKTSWWAGRQSRVKAVMVVVSVQVSFAGLCVSCTAAVS